MPTLSPMRQNVRELRGGLELLGRGKVRDSYSIDEKHMLVYATDGISIFDIVLNALVPEKGMVLTAMSHYWLKRLENELDIKTHLVAAGSDIDLYLPADLRNVPWVQLRAMVVRRLKMTDKEFVGRGFLTGSGLKSYQETGAVCGHILLPGLQDGDELPSVIDTPTTKANEGHDLPLDADAIRKQFPEETALLLKIYSFVLEEAKKNGIVFADTKLEFGRDENDEVILADEVATPDSSRYWEASVWAAGRKLEKRKAPPPYDKQIVREEGIVRGINKLDPLSSEDVAKAQAWQVPQELINATTQTYRYIFWRMTGMTLEKYQRDVLHVEVAPRKRKLAIVFGSDSDIPRVQMAMNVLSRAENAFSSGLSSTPEVHIISCHRNPTDLYAFASDGCAGADAVIAAGGKAFALPGVLDAYLHSKGKNIPVIGVALGDVGSVSLDAAKLSISELPGQPVVMDETRGMVHEGLIGFSAAIDRVANGEFPTPKKRVAKPSQFNIDLSALV